jgi:hypothetical protein
VRFRAAYRSHLGAEKDCDITVDGGRLVSDHASGFRTGGECDAVVDYAFEIYDVLDCTIDWYSDVTERFDADYSTER